MIRPLLTGLVLVLAMACAQVREPSGGARDETPPELVAADPPSGTVRFTGDRIVLRFSERIRLDRVRDNLLISPPLAHDPDVRTTGPKEVTIRLSGPLEPNTTYLFNLGDAVVDLTEGNKAAGLMHVLSTGVVLDSLELGGTVVDALTMEPAKNILVLLYDEDTSAFRSGRPITFTRTQADGSFLIPHLRAGSYHVRALRDQNNNRRFDLPAEAIGFLDAPIEVTPADSTPAEVLLRLFQEVGAGSPLREQRVIPDRAWRMVFHRPVDSVRLVGHPPERTTTGWTLEASAGRDTLLWWPSDTTLLEGTRHILLEGETPWDTLAFRARDPMPFHVRLDAITTEGESWRLRASRPIRVWNADRFELVGDTIRHVVAVEPDARDARIGLVRFNGAPAAGSRLLVATKAIRDAYGGWNDSTSFAMRTGPDPDAQATLTMRLDLTSLPPGSPCIVQVIDGQGKLVAEGRATAPGTTLTWDRLDPTSVGIRILLDINRNDHWDPGLLAAFRQPEPVHRHPAPVTLRAGWEVAVDIVWP